MNKSLLFSIMLLALVFIVSACARKHYAKPQGAEVVFYYKDKKAGEVLFASSRDNYRLHVARENKNHLWVVSVPAGKDFSYFYVVDGVITLPACQLTESDDFGSRNCIYPAEM